MSMRIHARTYSWLCVAIKFDIALLKLHRIELRREMTNGTRARTFLPPRGATTVVPRARDCRARGALQFLVVPSTLSPTLLISTAPAAAAAAAAVAAAAAAVVGAAAAAKTAILAGNDGGAERLFLPYIIPLFLSSQPAYLVADGNSTRYRWRRPANRDNCIRASTMITRTNRDDEEENEHDDRISTPGFTVLRFPRYWFVDYARALQRTRT